MWRWLLSGLGGLPFREATGKHVADASLVRNIPVALDLYAVVAMKLRANTIAPFFL